MWKRAALALAAVMVLAGCKPFVDCDHDGEPDGVDLDQDGEPDFVFDLDGDGEPG